MKRFLFASLAFLLFTTSTLSAQRNTISGAMITTTTDVIKIKKERKLLKTVNITKGFKQEVNLAYSFIDFLTSHLNFNYIAGYRFNHYLFVGAGAGLDFGCTNNHKPLLVRSGNYGGYYITNQYKYYDLPVQKVAIPLYAHFKAYFMKTRWAPFLAFSAGVRFSTAKKTYESVSDMQYSYKYGAVTGMFEVLPGVSFKYNDKYDFNFQFGYATRSGHFNYSGGIAKDWYHGFTAKFGFVF